MSKPQGAAVIGYIRVSTEDQAREGVSLEAQEAKVRAWWALEGAGRPLVLERDEGVSGCRMDRPGLERALAGCSRGGALVVYSLSRLARSTRGTLEVAARLEKAGCELVSLSERIDTGSAAGRMVFRMLAVLAEFERDQVSERTRMALAFKRARGERTSRYMPCSSAACARARELSASGLSLRAIGRRLSSEGVRTVTGVPWSAKVVRSMVMRKAAAA
jgi:DNA invertase Pin-like site-specific DNA recombinase